VLPNQQVSLPPFYFKFKLQIFNSNSIPEKSEMRITVKVSTLFLLCCLLISGGQGRPHAQELPGHAIR
jgi:hypothetical protein